MILKSGKYANADVTVSSYGVCSHANTLSAIKHKLRPSFYAEDEPILSFSVLGSYSAAPTSGYVSSTLRLPNE